MRQGHTYICIVLKVKYGLDSEQSRGGKALIRLERQEGVVQTVPLVEDNVHHCGGDQAMEGAMGMGIFSAVGVGKGGSLRGQLTYICITIRNSLNGTKG